MHPLLNIAISAARRAGDVIVRALDRVGTLTVSEKNRNDFVSEVDRAAEQVLIATIRKAYPAHGRSEEHTSELQSRLHLVCRLLLEKKKQNKTLPLQIDNPPIR